MTQQDPNAGREVTVDRFNASEKHMRRKFMNLASAGTGIALLGAAGSARAQSGAAAPFFNVRSYGATGNGATDDSAAVLSAIDAAVAAGGGTIYYPATAAGYLQSVVLQTNQALTFLGDGLHSVIIPKSVSQPAFALATQGGFAICNTWKFRNLRFQDPKTNSACGIWTQNALDLDGCFFFNLAYGVLANNGEWSKFRCTTWQGNTFGVFATSSNSADDPAGFGVSGGGNPSEQYFYGCWFGSNNTSYYEEQEDNQFDQTTLAHFIDCQFMTQPGTEANDILSIGGLGTITLDKCWFEGRSGSETGVTVRGRSFPTAIIYTEGASVTMRECTGLVVQNPIYVRYTTDAISASSPQRFPPALILEKTPAANGMSLNLAPDVISIFRDASVYGNGGMNLSGFTRVENVWPALPGTSAFPNGAVGGVIYPCETMPIVARAAGGVLVNLWPGGACAHNVAPLWGASATILSGDGFFSYNGAYRYLRVTAGNGQGVATGSFTSVANAFYVLTFAIRQSSGSSLPFFIGASGSPNPLTQIGWFNVPGDGGWRFFCGITGCATGGAGSGVTIVQNSGGTLSFDMSVIQLVSFASLQAAQQFARSGFYIETNPL